MWRRREVGLFIVRTWLLSAGVDAARTLTDAVASFTYGGDWEGVRDD